MAGTDSTRRPAKATAREAVDGAPAIILVHPQLGENIGMAARSMLNCGLTDLRLVKPRHGWPNDKAIKPSSGADIVLENARVFETTSEAVADLQLAIAATARPRGMAKEMMTPRRAAVEMRVFAAKGSRCGVVFGPEAKGLNNDDVALCDATLSVPLNPAFCSLNLAQAVLLVGYEWFLAGDQAPDSALPISKHTRPANKEELLGLFEHLERELDACGFLRVREKRPIMIRNLRAIFHRARLTEQEVRTLRGVIAGLSSKPRS